MTNHVLNSGHNITDAVPVDQGPIIGPLSEEEKESNI